MKVQGPLLKVQLITREDGYISRNDQLRYCLPKQSGCLKSTLPSCLLNPQKVQSQINIRIHLSDSLKNPNISKDIYDMMSM